MTDADHDEILFATDGAVATITLHRPDALNAITPTMLGQLNEAAAAAAADDDVRVVVLTGSGRAFSAGVDLKALGDRELLNGKVGDILDLPATRLTAALSTMPKPVVAKVNGFCFTGALELALACDIVVVANEAKLGDTHAKFGLRPTWGMSQRLPAAVGPARARLLSLTARMFSGLEAAEWGIAAIAAPLAELDATVEGVVADLLDASTESHAAYKDLFAVAAQHGLADGLSYETATDYTISDTAARLATFR